jgi:hypothetical protein
MGDNGPDNHVVHCMQRCAKQSKRPAGPKRQPKQPKWAHCPRKSSVSHTSSFNNQTFEGEGDTFRQRSEERLIIETLHTAKGVKVQHQRGRVTLLGISSQGPQDWLIGIEHHLRGATVGDEGRGPRRFPTRSPPSNTHPD